MLCDYSEDLTNFLPMLTYLLNNSGKHEGRSKLMCKEGRSSHIFI